MRAPESLPAIGRAYRIGVNPITTTLVLLGPILVALVAVAGRSGPTVALGVAYVLAVPASIAYFRLSGRAPDGGAGGAPDERETDDG